MAALEGRVALVTGSGRNIGRSAALALADLGARVAVHGRTDSAAVESVVADIRAHGGTAVPVMGDVSDPAQVAALVAEARTELGPIDILVSNAAVRPHGPFLDLTADDWRQVMATNLDATFHLSQAVIPDMLATGRGAIVAISGLAGWGVHGERVHVAASKAGLVGLVRGLAREFADRNIRVNCIVPSAVDTERRNPEWYPGPAYSNEQRLSRIPMKRQGRPDEVAATIAFLCTDGAGYITGQTVMVNGGAYM